MINLQKKYAKEIMTAFRKESILTGRLCTNYEFKGQKTVVITTPQTVPMNDYRRSGSNRYGEPTEMQDVIQEMTLSQDKGFSVTVDKGNNQEQGYIKAAGRMLKLQIKERAVPQSDKYGFEQLCQKGGKIVGNATALGKTNICDRISDGLAFLDDEEIPESGRTIYITAQGYKILRLSEEFLGADKLGEKSIAKGQVGEFGGAAVIKVPKGRWPANVNFIIVQKDCATFPVTLNETKLHVDPPGISGNLMEGRQIYDLFVFGARCNGVYVEVDTGSGKGTVCADPAVSTAGALSCTTSGATIKYTTDGSDPRYSPTAKIGTTSDVTTSGTVVKAYAFKAGCFPSGVAETTLSA